MQISKVLSIKIIIIFMLSLIPDKAAYAQVINHWETIIRSYDIWHYSVPQSEQPSDWNMPGFDDSSWSSGKGNIGYGEVDDSTIITPPVYSLYLRIKFNITDRSAISGAILNIDYDDSFVAYLNGHEIARANIGSPGDRPLYNAFANTNHEAALPVGGIPPGFPINTDTLSAFLADGVNLLAIEVHNNSLSSSDLSSTTFLSLEINNANSYYYPVPAWFSPPVSTSSDLPVISINTNGMTIPDGIKITASCKVINKGYKSVNDVNDPATDYDGLIGIELRGQSSLMFPKKPYSVEIRKTETVDSAASLLGMPKNKDWVLYPPYSDKTMMRNFLTYFLGSKMGSWQPRCRYCVLYLNGDYQGIYILMEHIRRDVNRVNISGLGTQDVTGDAVTGGYIIKADKLWGLTPEDYFTTYPGYMYPNTRNYTFTYVYPKANQIMPAQKSYIAHFIAQAETILNSPDFRDPVNGIQKYFDYGSFADFQIMTELSNNVDGYRLSQFFYKKKITHGNKLFCGPLWDIDLGYANENYYDYNWVTTGWLYPHYAPDWEHPMHYWARLMEDPLYVRRFVTRWRDLRHGAFATDSIMHIIDSIKTYLGNEIDRNYQKWPILGTWVWPNYYVGTTFDDELNFFKNWIIERLNWMDSATDLKSDLFRQAFSEDIITVYPTPVKDYIVITIKTALDGKAKIEIVDLFGKRIYGDDLSLGSGFQQITLDMSRFHTGYYILRVTQGSRLLGVKRVVKY